MSCGYAPQITLNEVINWTSVTQRNSIVIFFYFFLLFIFNTFITYIPFFFKVLLIKSFEKYLNK